MMENEQCHRRSPLPPASDHPCTPPPPTRRCVRHGASADTNPPTRRFSRTTKERRAGTRTAAILLSLGVSLLQLRRASAGSDIIPAGDNGTHASVGRGISGEDGDKPPQADVSSSSAGGEVGSTRAPKVPFCRAGAVVGTMWLPVWDSSTQGITKAKRIVVFGGKGLDYFRGGVSYLGDMWALRITNLALEWDRVIPHGHLQPSPRWQTGASTAFDTSMVIYGGDDQTTNEVGGLGDLWIYSPRAQLSRSDPNHELEDEWQYLERGGVQPGARREPSLTILNSTLVLQGGKMVDGEANEQCDSRLFLLDIVDPKADWREGESLPGDCAVGQTMDTVVIPHAKGAKERVVVFGGCQWSESGTYHCSDDLYAYDLIEDAWEKIIPESDKDADACQEQAAQGSSNLAGSALAKDSSAAKTNRVSVCPGKARYRPLGRHAHATAYVESAGESLHALFVFGGRENDDNLTPLGDLWMFDFDAMRWSEMTTDSKSPANRFGHSLSVWQGGVGDGVAGLVVFGGESFTHTGQAVYMNDVWLYTPHTGKWREVMRSSCEEGASGIVKGGGTWTALVALVTLLVLVVVVQCLLHNICPHYEPPVRRPRRRRRRRTEGTDDVPPSGLKKTPNGHVSTSALETPKAPLVGTTASRDDVHGKGNAGGRESLLVGSAQQSYNAVE